MAIIAAIIQKLRDLTVPSPRNSDWAIHEFCRRQIYTRFNFYCLNRGSVFRSWTNCEFIKSSVGLWLLWKLKSRWVAGEIKAWRNGGHGAVFRFQSRRGKEEERFLMCEKGPGVCSGNRSRCVPQKAVPGSNLEKSRGPIGVADVN